MLTEVDSCEIILGGGLGLLKPRHCTTEEGKVRLWVSMKYYIKEILIYGPFLFPYDCNLYLSKEYQRAVGATELNLIYPAAEEC